MQLQSGFNLLSEDDVFDEFFASDSKSFSHKVVKGENEYIMRRDESTLKSVHPSVKDFSSFGDCMMKLSIWGYSLVNFMLDKNGETVIHYELNQERIILPMLLNALDRDDVKIANHAMVFRNKAVKELMPQFEGVLIGMLKQSFNEQMV